MNESARALLNGLIDYAGLFPPAGLPMRDAVLNYAGYQRRPDSWALGRFVVPVARLAEFEVAVGEMSERDRLGARWPLTGLLGTEVRSELSLVEAFSERYLHGGPELLSLETRVANPGEIASLRALVPPRYELYLELPLTGPLEPLLEALVAVGARAKIRTGGIQAADIPPVAAVLGFLSAAARQRVPFKATAGLHHPVRGPAPLTYQPGSALATMLGYLNVFLAAVALWRGDRPEQAARLLEAEDRTTLEVGGESIRWVGVELRREEIAKARREFALAVGSCSFTEPVEEIETL